jgi:hypothetical protein
MEQAITAPVRSDCYENLGGDQVLEIFQNATTKYRDSIAQAPPVLPIEGEVYLFDLGPDNASWEQMKKKYRYGLSSSFSLSTFKPVTCVFVWRFIRYIFFHSPGPNPLAIDVISIAG